LKANKTNNWNRVLLILFCLAAAVLLTAPALAVESCPDCHGASSAEFELSPIINQDACIFCHGSVPGYSSAAYVHSHHCGGCHEADIRCTTCHPEPPHSQHGSSQIEPVTRNVFGFYRSVGYSGNFLLRQLKLPQDH